MRRVVLTALLLAACDARDHEASEVAPLEEDACRSARWEKLGLARGLPEPAMPGAGVLSPALLEDGGVLHLWFAEKTAGGYALQHATSRDDGETFDAIARVTGLAEGAMQAYPSVWKEGATFHLVYGSGTFKRATSGDGVHFTPEGASVLSAGGDAARFDRQSILYPAVVHDGGLATLFFTGFDGHSLRIGRAVADGGRFAVDPPRPVLDLGPAPEPDNAGAAQPHVVRDGARLWMWYGGYDTSAVDPGPYRVLVASSADGIAWEKRGVAIELSPRGTDAWSTRDPSVVRVGDRQLLFYVGLGDDGRYRLHRAARAACR